MRGFTLIEMLIVVAIIGILAALLIPNAMSALQKAKQKGTIKDINTIATGLMDYVTDKGGFLASASPSAVWSGALTDNCSLIQALQGFYVKVFPAKDQWGNYFYVWTGKESIADAWYVGANIADPGDDDFAVGSAGRNGTAGDYTGYDSSDPSTGFYEVSSMKDFNNEILNWNGSIVIGPRTAGQTSGTGTGTGS